MYVKNQMTTDVVTIFKDASINLAFQLMMEKGCKQIPVIEDRRFIGMVTEQLLTEVSPSKATSLSVYEINYLLSKTKVKDIMAINIPTCTSDMLIEEAALLLKQKDVDALPVVENGELLGIITRTDILDAFLESSGIQDIGTRIALEVKDEVGNLAEIANIIKDFGVNISHVINYNHINTNNYSEIILRLSTLEVDAIISALEKQGYHVRSIKKTT